MTDPIEQDEVRPSAKREAVATVVSVTAGIVMSIGTTILINRASKKIHDQIAPPENTEE